MNLILNLFGVIILSFSTIYAWSILIGKKINFQNYKLYLSIIFFSILLIINYENVNKMFKYLIITLIISVFVKFIFNKNIKVSLITAFYTQLLNTISELLFSIIIVIVFKEKIGFYSNIIVFFADLFVSAFCIILSKIKIIRNLYLYIVDFLEKISTKVILICLLPILFLFNIYLAITYYSFNSIYFIIANNLSIYIIVAIILILINKEKAYDKIYDKYELTLESLKEYEDILDEYRISNHENKNQLLTIRNMVHKNNKKVINYIDKIVENKLLDNDKLMQQVSVIPPGGIRGLIYSKILFMKNNNINNELIISAEIKTVNLIKKIDNGDILDICQILGVFLDNAIDAVQNIVEKNIAISIYIEDKNLVFEIANSYNQEFNVSKIGQIGYSTKGTGHGYGLSLVRKIIKSNNKLSNVKKIDISYFSQILKYKLK